MQKLQNKEQKDLWRGRTGNASGGMNLGSKELQRESKQNGAGVPRNDSQGKL